MQSADILSFTVAGHAAPATVTLPCDGTAYPVTLSIRARNTTGAAVILPVWIGDLNIFLSDDLISDVWIFAPPKGNWQTITRTYSVTCTAGCTGVTGGGPVTGAYATLSTPRTLTAGMWDIGRFGPSYWRYFGGEIDLRCSPNITAPQLARADVMDGSLHAAREAVVAKALDLPAGETAWVTEDRQIAFGPARPQRRDKDAC